MLRENTKKVLLEFAKSVEQKAAANLGKSVKDWKSEVKEMPNSIVLSMSMAEYLHYQDEGVQGFRSSAKAPNSRFRFGSGKPQTDNGRLRDAMFLWVKKKRIQWRTKKGRFLDYKRTANSMAWSIYQKGLKPSMFMTKALESELKTLPEELVEAYGLDIETFLDFAFKDSSKSINKQANGNI